jgi:mono/diheme cytochrome c family protein
LHRWELPFVKALLADPRWSDERPGRSSLLQILASAVMRERHPINIDELLTLAADQPSDSAAWRKRSLLAGLSAVTSGRSLRPVRLRNEPAPLEQLAKSDDPETHGQIEKIKSLLAWPGHQSDLSEQRPAGRPLTPDEQQSVADGKLVFREVCAGCHGLTGQGIRPLAAPLVDSDWVLGSEDRLIRVLLHGLTGPVRVDEIDYQPPIVLPEMPAVGALEDAKIASVLSYVRREWGHEADPVSKDQVAEIRRETKGRLRPWTAEELK